MAWRTLRYFVRSWHFRGSRATFTRKQTFRVSPIQRYAHLRRHLLSQSGDTHPHPSRHLFLQSIANSGPYRQVRAMTALPPITDVGRHIQVSIWLSVYTHLEFSRLGCTGKGGGGALGEDPAASLHTPTGGKLRCRDEGASALVGDQTDVWQNRIPVARFTAITSPTPDGC
jgi:hypothetical protein